MFKALSISNHVVKGKHKFLARFINGQNSAGACRLFYAPQLYRQVLLWRVLAMGILSVCLSVRLSRPGTDSMPGEIETPGLHHMIV